MRVDVFTWADVSFRGQKQWPSPRWPPRPMSLGTLRKSRLWLLLLLLPCLAHPAWPLFRQPL